MHEKDWQVFSLPLFFAAHSEMTIDQIRVERNEEKMFAFNTWITFRKIFIFFLLRNNLRFAEIVRWSSHLFSTMTMRRARQREETISSIVGKTNQTDFDASEFVWHLSRSFSSPNRISEKWKESRITSQFSSYRVCDRFDSYTDAYIIKMLPEEIGHKINKNEERCQIARRLVSATDFVWRIGLVFAHRVTSAINAKWTSTWTNSPWPSPCIGTFD